MSMKAKFIEEDLTPKIVKALCNDCGVELESSNMVLTSYPPQYPHHCPECGLTTNLDRSYPNIGFFDKDGKKVY